MIYQQPNIPLLLQQAVMHIVERTCKQKDWGLDPGNNQGLLLDLTHEINKYTEKLRFLSMEITERGLEIQATAGPTLTSWAELRGTVYQILGVVAEQFLAVTQMRDEQTIQFWFAMGDMTGQAPHGHFGVITFSLEEVKYLDPDE